MVGSHLTLRTSHLTTLPACMLSRFSRVRLFATPWVVARQTSLSLGFSRREYWSGLPFPSLRDLPDPGIEPMYLSLAGRFFTTEPLGKPWCVCVYARVFVCVCVQVGNLHRSSGSQGLRGPQALRSACFCLSTDSSVGWRGSCWAMASSLSFLGRHTWIQSPLPSANSKLLLGGFYNIEPYFPLHGTAVRMKRGHLGASICHLVRACFLSPSFLLVISSFVTVVREILPAHCGHFKLGCIHLYV